jgi:hypothetical protein
MLEQQRRKLVVVAEYPFPSLAGCRPEGRGTVQLLRRNSVVLIHDGDDAEGEQSVQRAAQVGVALRVAEVVFGEQDLRDGAAVAVEGIVVQAHETRLADGGAGLDLSQYGGAFDQAEPLHAQAHGAGADHEDLCSLSAQGGDLLHQATEQAEGNTAVGPHDNVGAEFDDDAAH